jgi:hypothetical protein
MLARALACGPDPHEEGLRIEALAELSDFRAVRLGPEDDLAAVTAAQVRSVLGEG